MSFSPQEASYHEVTPYAEVYGIHPREFHFDRDAFMVPATHPWSCSSTGTEDEDSSDSDEELEAEEYSFSIVIE